jgi:peroxiredoxin
MLIRPYFLRAVVLALLLSFAAATHAEQPDKSELLNRSGHAEVGKPAPWLSGWTLNNQVFNIRKEFKDHPDVQRLAVVFFASYCKPCRIGLADLKDAEQRLQRAGVRVILIACKDNLDDLNKFVRQHQVPFTVVLDSFGQAEKSYFDTTNGTLAIPRTVVLERGGTIKTIIGAEGKDYIDLLLAQ